MGKIKKQVGKIRKQVGKIKKISESKPEGPEASGSSKGRGMRDEEPADSFRTIQQLSLVSNMLTTTIWWKE